MVIGADFTDFKEVQIFLPVLDMRFMRYKIFDMTSFVMCYFRSLFCIDSFKTEYLHCCFSGTIEEGGEITLDGRVIPKVAKFKYLGSIIQQNGDIDEDINQSIRVGWSLPHGCCVIRMCP